MRCGLQWQTVRMQYVTMMLLCATCVTMVMITHNVHLTRVEANGIPVHVVVVALCRESSV